MATNNQTVSISFTANASGAISGTANVARGMGNVQQAAASANATLTQQQRTLSSLNSSFQGLNKSLMGLVAGYISLGAVRTLANFADEYVNLNSRLRIVLDTTEQYNIAQRQVMQIAQETYSSLEATANLYSRLVISLEDLGSSQNEIAGITRTVNQALLISGATASESASAILQLSQSFASGVLRGEEFNAVNEAGPRIMQALAKSLNVSRGALREMASEGKLTAEVLRKALVDDAANIAAEASKVPLTIGRAYQQFRNNLLTFVGETDKAYTASNRVAKGIAYIGQNLESLAGILGTTLSAIAVFAGARGIVAIVTAAANAGGAITLLRTGMVAFGVAVGGLPTLIAAGIAGLVLLTHHFLTTHASVEETSEAIRKFRELTANGLVSRDAGELFRNTVTETLARIKELRAEVEKLLAGPTDPEFGTFDISSKINEIQQLEEKLAQLGAEGSTSLKTLGDGFINAFQNADVATSATEQFANAQTQLNTILKDTQLGKQTQAAQEFKASLQALQELEKREPRLHDQIQRGIAELTAAYNKEQAQIVKSTTVRGESQTHINAEASARDRLVGVIERYSDAVDASTSVEEKRAAIIAKFAAVQRQVDADLRNYPALANTAATATEAIAAALSHALDEADPFRAEVKKLLETFKDGNVDATSQAFLRLSLAIEEATNAGDEKRVKQLQLAMENLELSTGKAATASQVYAESASKWSEYWLGAVDEVSNVFGEFVASGLQDFGALADGLKNIAKKIVADLIAEFFKLSVINPLLNSIFGTGLQTGGSQLGQIFGGGGTGSNLFSTITSALSSFFGGGTNSARMGINQVNAITGAVGPSGGAAASGLGISGSGLGTSFAGVPIVGWIAAAMAQNMNLFSQGWGYAGGSLTLPNGQRVSGGGGESAAGFGATAGMVGGLDRLFRGLGLGSSTASLLSGSAIHTRLFGHQAPILTNAQQSLTFGADGIGGSESFRTLERGGVFSSDRRRTRTYALSEEAQAQAQQVFDALSTVVADSARSLKGEAPALLDSALRTVQEFDSKGKLKATKYFVDVLGRSWEEATSEDALTRLSAENIIHTIDSILGTTVEAATTGVEQIFTDIAGTITAGSQSVGSSVGDIVKSVASLGEASSIAERWRDDANLLMEGAQFLLAAATDIRAGAGLLGEDGTLTEIADLVESLQYSNETLIETYGRLVVSTNAVNGLLTALDGTFAGTRTELVTFSAALVEMAGGVQSFQTLMSSAFDALFSPREQAEMLVAQTRTNLNTALQRVGLDLSSGTTAIRESLRTQLRDALASGNTELVYLLLQAGSALNDYGLAVDNLATIVNAAGQSATTATTAVNNLGLSFEELLATAVSFDPSQAMNEYRSFVAGISGTSPNTLSQFNQAVVDANQWVTDTIERANQLAGAAGMQRAAEEDLIAIHEEGARRVARAIQVLMDASADIAKQLYQQNPQSSMAGLIYGRLQTADPTSTLDPQRFQLATQLAQNVRELSEALGQSFQTILTNLQVPLDQFLADLNVNVNALDVNENFDNLVSAAQLLGAELSDMGTSLHRDFGRIEDDASQLNNAFERVAATLPSALSGTINSLLTRLENAQGPEAIAAARRDLVQFLEQQTPAIRAQFAPFFNELDVGSIQQQQVAAIDLSNRYLSASTEYLRRIAASTGGKPVSGPPVILGEKSAQDTTNALLARAAAAMEALTVEIRGKNIRAATGANGVKA